MFLQIKHILQFRHVFLLKHVWKINFGVVKQRNISQKDAGESLITLLQKAITRWTRILFDANNLLIAAACQFFSFIFYFLINNLLNKKPNIHEIILMWKNEMDLSGRRTIRRIQLKLWCCLLICRLALLNVILVFVFLSKCQNIHIFLKASASGALYGDILSVYNVW